MSKPVKNSIRSLKKKFTKKIKGMVKPGVHVFVTKNGRFYHRDGCDRAWRILIWKDCSRYYGSVIETIEEKRLLWTVLQALIDYDPQWLVETHEK